jgi:hypothetical protein
MSFPAQRGTRQPHPSAHRETIMDANSEAPPTHEAEAALPVRAAGRAPGL